MVTAASVWQRADFAAELSKPFGGEALSAAIVLDTTLLENIPTSKGLITGNSSQHVLKLQASVLDLAVVDGDASARKSLVT